MITTYQALIVALLVILPGASYTFAVERTVGSYGVNFSDRLLRFLAASAVFHAVFAGLEYWLYTTYVASGRLTSGGMSWWVLELVALVYVFLPIGVGYGLGQLRKQDVWLGRWIVGEQLEPRAWDYLWTNSRGIVRLKLKSGTWLAGVYGTVGRKSWASGFPTEDSDLYLAAGLDIDERTGTLRRDNEGRATYLEGRPGLLVRWNEVEYLEFQEF